jgi:hypothetical protein
MMNYQTYRYLVKARIERRNIARSSLNLKDDNSMADVVAAESNDDEEEKDQLFEFITRMNEHHNKNIVERIKHQLRLFFSTKRVVF